MILPHRIWTSFATFAVSVMLCGLTAVAQMTPSPGSIPQPGMPPGSQQTQPGMGPLNPTMNGDGQTSVEDRVFVEDALKERHGGDPNGPTRSVEGH